MKKLLTIFLIFAFIPNKIYAKSSECVNKAPMGSMHYYERIHDIDIYLGRLYIENSKLLFEPSPNEKDIENILIRDKYKKMSADKIIEDSRKSNLIKISTKKKLLNLINQEIVVINKYNGFSPDLNDTYLDIKTKKIYFIELRTRITEICDKEFLDSLIYYFYTKYDILIRSLQE